MTALAWWQDAEDATANDKYDVDPPLTRRPPAPQPFRLPFYGPHDTAWCTHDGCDVGNPWHEHKAGAA